MELLILKAAFKKCDGDSSPLGFVLEQTNFELYTMITVLMAELGYEKSA